MVFISRSITTIAQDLVPEIKTITMGDDTVQLYIYVSPGANIAYAHIHENETASLEAGITSIKNYGGKLVTLVHSFDGSKNRNVTFMYNTTQYQFDPNRIYTDNDSVLYNNIKVVKGTNLVDTEVFKIVKNLANQIWNEVASAPTIVALHNNKNTPAEYTNFLFWKKVEPESYSIVSYIMRSDHASDSNHSCSDIYINASINNSEFFIVTEKRDFDLLASKRSSVVLQNATPVDDGSMSVFAAFKNKRYLNAEAKHGRVAEQTQMLKLINE